MQVLRKINPIKLPRIFSYSTKTEGKLIDVDGQTIHYIKTGNGPKTVFCWPGALGTIWSDFKPQIEGLNKEKLTVIAWDPPGYGNSRPPNRNFNINFYEQDADVGYKFMQAMKIPKFSLLGWSDGGISSMIFAAKYPEAVEKLVIWGSNSYVTKGEIEIYEKMRDLSKWSDKMKSPLIEMYTEQGLQDIWNGWCDALNEISKKNNGDICKELLPKIKCPTFILHGNKDPMVAAEHPQHLLINIKESQIFRFPDGKHNIHLRYANDFNKLVEQFVLS